MEEEVGAAALVDLAAGMCGTLNAAAACSAERELPLADLGGSRCCGCLGTLLDAAEPLLCCAGEAVDLAGGLAVMSTKSMMAQGERVSRVEEEGVLLRLLILEEGGSAADEDEDAGSVKSKFLAIVAAR